MNEDETRILLRTPEFLVVDKPPFLPTTSADKSDCLVDRVRALDPDAPLLHPVSRLDAPVTGAVLFARTRAANDAVRAARADGCYERVYAAIAKEALEIESGDWSWAIGIRTNDRKHRTTVSSEGTAFRPAATHFTIAGRTGVAALLVLRPRTGRTHQLRAHAARAGVPLLGDVAYGGARRTVLSSGRVITAPRVMLHAHHLRLTTPAGTLEATSPLPDDFRALWVALGGVNEELLDLV